MLRRLREIHPETNHEQARKGPGSSWRARGVAIHLPPIASIRCASCGRGAAGIIVANEEGEMIFDSAPEAVVRAFFVPLGGWVEVAGF
jgi:hypothetical protein